MKKTLFILLLIPFVCNAQIRYVATDGDDDTGDGSIGSPYATWQKGIDETHAGDTLYIRGGTYNSYARVRIDTTLGTPKGHSGTPTKPILIAGYPTDITSGNWPILDCRLHCDSIQGATVYNAGIIMNRIQYVTLKCLEIKNVWQCDSVLSGAISATDVANITYERLRVHNIGERGFYHASGAWDYADSAYTVDYKGTSPADASPIWEQPDTTRWINCDVWDLCDTLGVSGSPNPGNGGDAWKVMSANGNYYLWEGCRAWNYSDDGYDPNGGKRVFNNCWSMSSNKYAEFGIEGNGFKTSALTDHNFLYYTEADSIAIVGDSMVIQTNCLAIYCPGAGFYHGPESEYTDNPRYYNNTAYACGIGVWSFLGHNIGNYDTLNDIYRNNISYGSTDVTGGGDTYSTYIPEPYEESNNTWIGTYYYGPDNPTFTVTDADFVTVDSTTLVSLFTAERQADGSLPTNRPMRLVEGSDLIDGGVDVGLTYNGTAPDLGYAEWSSTDTLIVADFSATQTSIGTGGSINFTDLSTNNPTSWDWYFEGGTPDSSALENPIGITYSSAGTYDVELIAIRPNNRDTLLRENYITVADLVPNPPVADFSASVTSILQRQSVTYTDLSTNTPTSWLWTFEGGNPSTSTDQNPTVYYYGEGIFNVTLVATNADGFDSETKTDHVTVTKSYKILIK